MRLLAAVLAAAFPAVCLTQQQPTEVSGGPEGTKHIDGMPFVAASVVDYSMPVDQVTRAGGNAAETPAPLQPLASGSWDSGVTLRPPLPTETGMWAVILRIVVQDLLLAPAGGLSRSEMEGLAFAMKNTVRFLPPGLVRFRVTTADGGAIVPLGTGGPSFTAWRSVVGPNVLASLLLEDPTREPTTAVIEAAILVHERSEAESFFMYSNYTSRNIHYFSYELRSLWMPPFMSAVAISQSPPELHRVTVVGDCISPTCEHVMSADFMWNPPPGQDAVTSS